MLRRNVGYPEIAHIESSSRVPLTGTNEVVTLSRIVEAQHASGVQGDVPVIVELGRGAGGEYPEAPGHAEVHDQAAGVEADQQVFSTAIDAADDLPGERGLEAGLDGPA